MGDAFMKIAALAGGVGAAKLISGLVKLISPKDLTVIVNTGDDVILHGLYISPDVDIITYTLAGLVDERRGWGIKEDTYNCLEMLGKYGGETWFNLGDKDLATHIFRTKMLKEGFTLTQIAKKFTSLLNVQASILPMSDERVETMIHIEGGMINFQRYLVERGARDEVLGVEFIGARSARPAPGVIESLLAAEKVVVCPSNPVVSIGPILAVHEIRDTLRELKTPVVAVSPIIQGSPVKGPADKLMRGLNLEVSARSVASLYKEFLDTMVIDEKDEAEEESIKSMGLKVLKTDIAMRSLEDKVRVAKLILEA
ncbi:MAG: 2-phospho-L-lactate transferase [Candidatus Bathyarchaeia archaeon]